MVFTKTSSSLTGHMYSGFRPRYRQSQCPCSSACARSCVQPFCATYACSVSNRPTLLVNDIQLCLLHPHPNIPALFASPCTMIFSTPPRSTNITTSSKQFLPAPALRAEDVLRHQVC